MSTEKAPRAAFIATFSIGMVATLQQISISRVLSATIDYHAAFGVIALVMLGLATSGTAVFLHRNRPEPVGIARATLALSGAGLAAALGIFAYVYLGALGLGSFDKPAHTIGAAVFFFPSFFLAGYALSFLLAEFARDVSRLYWFDLTGAGLGCLAVVPLLDVVSAPHAVMICAALLCIGGVAMALGIERSEAARKPALVMSSLVAVALAVSFLVPASLSLKAAKSQSQEDLLWEEWNHTTRVNVIPYPPGVMDAVADLGRERYPDLTDEQIAYRWASGWGLSRKFDGWIPESVYLQLDTGAGTPILKDGVARLDDLEILEWDVTAAVYHLQRGDLENAFVVGGGGGRDILTALRFGAEEVNVVELNPGVVRAVEEAFGDYSGNPYQAEGVSYTVGEGRNVLAREGERYDVIQISMIDTFASSAAGSMVFTENGLYTVEAWDLFYEHLSDDGMLSVSRWYSKNDFGEVGRALAIASGALQQNGVEKPEDHVAALITPAPYGAFQATVLMKRSPLDGEDRARLSSLAERMAFGVVWPGLEGHMLDHPIDVPAIMHGRDFEGQSNYIFEPPTDDNPFFFATREPISSLWMALTTGKLPWGGSSGIILGFLVLIALVVSHIFVLRPLREWNERQPPSERRPVWGGPMLYFAGIGFGFMCVELAVIQRYITFLGHPTYALSVVLFALLVFGGVGSSLSGRFSDYSRVRLALAGILAGVLFTAFVVPFIVDAAFGWQKSARIALSVALIAPLAIAMGMIYPLGVRILVETDNEPLIAWGWAVNGVCGVLATTLGMYLAMSFGYTALLLVGAAGYGATYFAVTRVADGDWP